MDKQVYQVPPFIPTKHWIDTVCEILNDVYESGDAGDVNFDTVEKVLLDAGYTHEADD